MSGKHQNPNPHESWPTMVEKMFLRRQDCSCASKFFAHRAGVRNGHAKRIKRAYKAKMNDFFSEIVRAANARDFELIEGLATPQVECSWELT